MPINYFDIEKGIAGFFQKNYEAKMHQHFSIEVAFALKGKIEIETAYQQYKAIQSAIIQSNVPHRFSCKKCECQLYFADPTSRTGEHLIRLYLPETKNILIPVPFDKATFREKLLAASPGQDILLKDRDSRVQHCLDFIDINSIRKDIHISILSSMVYLSESRLAHLFKDQVGISLQQYILWKKTERAINHSLEGFSLTQAAHYAGFSDSSHFNKTFKKMFGIYPSFIFKD